MVPQEANDLEPLKASGTGVSDNELEARRATVQPDTLATIIYTSGTTGRPKGCMLTHKNLMFEVENVIAGLKNVFMGPGASTLLFLPVAHVFGRLIQLGAVRAQTRLGHAPDVKQLLPLLQSKSSAKVINISSIEYDKPTSANDQKEARKMQSILIKSLKVDEEILNSNISRTSSRTLWYSEEERL